MSSNEDKQTNANGVSFGRWISSTVSNVVQSAMTGAVAGVATYFISKNLLGDSPEVAKQNAFALGNGVGGVTLATKTITSTWTAVTESISQ